MIKWTRLRKISEDIVDRKVSINLSTDAGIDGYIALTEFNKEKVNVFVNGNKCKDISEVIDALSHELAHVNTNSRDHDNKHSAEWERIKTEMIKRYADNAKE